MKFILDHIFLFAIVILSGGALLWPAVMLRGKRASVLEVTQLINRGKSTIVDVRGAQEFSEGHLRDAKNIPLPELRQRIAELDKSKARTVVLVCQSGGRSASAARILEQGGFEAVSLDGGMAEWQKQNLPITK
ncbi:MAG: rhodanese-like domain-containing protein [Pseudomonadota bacterium]